jgi:hypothetical protein
MVWRGLLTVAAVAAVISYRHAYELVGTHDETGLTARLLPFTVDGLILAASMLIFDASRRAMPVPPLARWRLGAGIGANLAHGLGQGPIGALVSAWPALVPLGNSSVSLTWPFRLRGGCGDGWLTRCCSRSSACSCAGYSA